MRQAANANSRGAHDVHAGFSLCTTSLHDQPGLDILYFTLITAGDLQNILG